MTEKNESYELNAEAAVIARWVTKVFANKPPVPTWPLPLKRATPITDEEIQAGIRALGDFLCGVRPPLGTPRFTTGDWMFPC